MKSKFSIVLLAGILISFVTTAGTSFLSITPAAKANVFNIRYQGTEVGNVRVSIFSEKNYEIFSEVFFNVSTFVRPYNFSELNAGEYTVIVTDKYGKQVEKINYSQNQVSSSVTVSEVANKENKYLLNVTNNGTENIYVRILAEDGTTLHEQSVEVTGNFSLIYDLNKVKTYKPTSVTFEVTSGSGKVEYIKF